MRFSDDFIEQVRNSTNIIDLIGQYVQLQKAGASFRGLCPFPGHAEKTPSFYVSDAKQLYHCFGCKKSGTIYNFLMDFQGLTFPEAVKSLAQRANIAIPDIEKKALQIQSGSRQEKATYLKLNRYTGLLFQKNLQSKPPDHPVCHYIESRGLSEEILKEFKLGYAEAGWHDLASLLKRGNAPLTAAEKLGLIRKKANGEYFDLFRDRLIFPILSASGDVVGFGGRSLDNEQQPKYLNSPETPLFHKGKILYGLHATAKYIRAQNEAYVVEGYMDLIALYQFGVKNVVASLGTAFTLEHAHHLKKLCENVIVLFDGDQAGLAAADKSLSAFLDAGLFSRFLTLPEAKDPDEFLRGHGSSEVFLKLAQDAPDHFMSFLSRQMQNYRGRPTEKVEILNKTGPILERVRDQRLRILYLQEMANRLGVELEWVERQLSRYHIQVAENINKNENNAADKKIPIEESVLVRFMLGKPEYLEHIRSSGVVEKFFSQEARMVAERIIEKYCQNPNDFDRLGALLMVQVWGQEQKTPEIYTQLLTDHVAGEVMEELDAAGQKQLINDCLVRVKERDLKIKSKSILNSIRSEQNSSSEKLEDFLKIAKEQKGPRGIQ